MDFIIVAAIGAILVATGVISPKPDDSDLKEEAKVIKTEEITIPPPEIKPEPEPEPEPEQTEPEPDQNQNRSQNQLKSQKQKRKLIKNKLKIKMPNLRSLK